MTGHRATRGACPFLGPHQYTKAPSFCAGGTDEDTSSDELIEDMVESFGKGVTQLFDLSVPAVHPCIHL